MIFFLTFLLFFACKKPDFPLIEKQEMKQILLEIYRTDGAFEALRIRYGVDREPYYNNIFLKHNTTRENFELSAAWYSQDSKDWEALYAEILDTLKADNERILLSYYHPVDTQKNVQLWDTFDIWRDTTALFFATDSVMQTAFRRGEFAFSDTGFFARGDRFELQFLQRSALCDSFLAFTDIRVEYADSVVDTIEVALWADDKLRRYRLEFNNLDTAEVVSVRGVLFWADTLKMLPETNFDSIKLLRKSLKNPENVKK